MMRTFLFLFTTVTLSLLSGCTCSETAPSLKIKIDGSSTVYPITEAMAEEFQKENPNIRVTIGVSGTGGGFKKFISKEIDINNASRKIKDIEKEKADAKNVDFKVFSVAYDGISVVVHPENSFISKLSTKDLNNMWKPGSQIHMWSDINPSFPKQKIKLYGPGHDSGTFDYFTKVINGKSQKSRSDFTQSEDDNMLVNGVSGDKYSLGFFGYAYYYENRNKIKAVPISYKGEKAVMPNFESIQSGTYKPLSRPLFIYVRKSSLKREEVSKFMEFYLKRAGEFVGDVGYIPLSDAEYERQLRYLREK